MTIGTRDFRRLKVWEKAHTLTLAVYEAISSFPRDEVYALTSQMRRSVVSIPSNIAEGCGRGSKPDLIRFFHIALGSTTELDYQLQLSHELNYLSDDVYRRLHDNVAEVRRMLISLIGRIRSEGDSAPNAQGPGL